MIKIVDVKCPDSGEADTFDFAILGAIDEKDEIKFVISTRRDYEFARDFTREHGLARRVREVLFSPVFPDPAGKWAGTRRAGTCGMDPGGRVAGAAGIAAPQIHMGSGDEGCVRKAVMSARRDGER